MSKDLLRLGDYLGHILQAIARIQSYCSGLDEAAFLTNTLVQDTVVRNFEIIGEASKNISRSVPEFVAAHPDLPLAFAYDMRSLLAHGYHQVDVGVVWRTVEADLPYLHSQISEALRTL